MYILERLCRVLFGERFIGLGAVVRRFVRWLLRFFRKDMVVDWSRVFGRDGEISIKVR